MGQIVAASRRGAHPIARASSRMTPRQSLAPAPHPPRPRRRETAGRSRSPRSRAAGGGEGGSCGHVRLSRNPPRGNDEAANRSIQVRDSLQMAARLEAELRAEPPAGLVVIEVHRQERRHPQSRTLGDDVFEQLDARAPASDAPGRCTCSLRPWRCKRAGRRRTNSAPPRRPLRLRSRQPRAAGGPACVPRTSRGGSRP